MTAFLSKYSSRKFIIAVLVLGYFMHTQNTNGVLWVAGIYLAAQGGTDMAAARATKQP